MLKKSVSLIVAICLLVSVLVVSGLSAASNDEVLYVSMNPYENIDWAAVNAYRAQFHVHTWRSDGTSPSADKIRDYYDKGFDILAIADHDVLCNGDWTQIGYGAWDPGSSTNHGRPLGVRDITLTQDEKDAIINGTAGPFNIATRTPTTINPNTAFTGTRQQSNGMIPIPYVTEHSTNIEHFVSMWTDFVMTPGNHVTKETAMQIVEDQNGIGFIPHPGRYTGGFPGGDPNINNQAWADAGAAASNDPANIAHYVDLFMRFPRTVGMEIFNRLDNETVSDRILWDNILMETMPQGRNVFAFSTDDTHRVQSSGFSWNVMLLPELTADATKSALENGEFFAVTRVARREGVNADAFRWGYGNGGPSTQPLLYQTNIPGITEIATTNNNSVITITGYNYDVIEWIADGVVIHTGNSLDLNAHADVIYSYVRAQMLSNHGALMTNAFGVGGSVPNNPVVSDANGTESDPAAPESDTDVPTSTPVSGADVGGGAAGGGNQPDAGVLAPIAALITLTIGSGGALLARKKKIK